MTDLIPRDAAIEAITTCRDAAVADALGRQLCCSGYMCGCRGATVEEMLTHEIRSIPTIDPAAIREEALREAAAKCAEHAEAARKKLGASETREEASAWALIVTRCDLLEDAILALIGEKK